MLLFAVLKLNTVSAQYCIPTFSPYSTCTGGSVLNVTFEAINNSPACAIGSGYYRNFTASAATASVVPGGSYPISITVGSGWSGGCAAWVDFNQDQVFDLNEKVFIGPVAGSFPFTFTGTVSIPVTALPGTTRMRVIGNEGNTPTSTCGSQTWGEAHDYAVNIGGTPDNAGVTALTDPLPGTFCPGSTVNAKVNVINAGNNQINGVTVDWELDGIAQPSVFWGTTIDTFGSVSGNNAEVTLGSIAFSTGAARSVKAWTSMPNSVVDTLNNNDTLWATLKPALSGVYTIGATGADFISVAAAAADLNTSGICGPVLFNVLAGTFTGQVSLNKEIRGSSVTNSITFKGIDTTATIITSTGSSTIALIGTNHVTFRDMRIQNTASGAAIWLTNDNGDGADSNFFINCRISCPLVTSSSGGHGILASSSATGASAGNNANYTLVDSCVITGGIYGAYFYGDDQQFNVANTVRHSFISNNYSSGIAAQYQSAFKAQKNTVAYTGNLSNTFPTSISLRENGFVGSTIEKNKIYGALGGYGIMSLWNTNITPDLVANNMIILGSGNNTSMGIRTYSNDANVIYNTIDVRSIDLNSTAYNLIPTAGYRYNVLNNVFRNANPGQVINVNTAPGATIKLDNNCYYGTGNFPYRSNNTNQTTLADFITSVNIFSDSFSIEHNPVFFSATDLRSTDASLDGKGRPVPFVTTDIDDSLRSVNVPDMGINEFTLPPRSDAGVLAIIAPDQPVTPGPADVKVVIKNMGIGDLSYVEVFYESGATSFNQIITRAIPQGKTDTVVFAVSSGPGIDQRLTIPTTSFAIKAWTANPNVEADTDNSNDTLTRSYCQPLNGAYTINASGSGATNFTSINAAITALTCGGVSGPVVFNMATGTYAEQAVIPRIAGSDSANTITFTSATHNSNDVTISYASTADSNNYVITFLGTRFIRFEDVSVINTGTSYSRAFVYKTTGGNGNSHISVNRCKVSGPVATTSTTDLALFYAADNNTDIEITNNTITNGAYGILLNGWPVVNQYSENARIDSNTFSNNYSSAINASNRKHISIKANRITNTDPFAGKNAIFIGAMAGNVSVTQNRIELYAGTGINVNNYAYYSETGRASVSNNTILLNGTGNISQTGIRLLGASQTDVYNNTVKLSSSKSTVDAFSSSNFGLYVEGDISYGNLGNATSNDVKVVNNIFYTENGYPVYFASKFFGTGGRVSANSITQIDYNLYYNNNGSNVAYVYGNTIPDYPKTSFDAYRRAVYWMADLSSIYVQPVFTATGDLKPDSSSPAAWYVNGRGVQLPDVTEDIAGTARSIAVQTGPTDLGAFEFTPVSLPPPATAVPATPVAGQTQSFLFLGDTVAKITWDASFTAPSSVEVSQYVGEKPAYIGEAPEYMYVYAGIKLPPTSGSYMYSADLFYKEIWTGTITSEINMALIHYTQATGWDATSSAFFSSTVDDVNNIISAPALVDSVILITGTSKSYPLPVELLQISATKKHNDVLVSWTTASEINSDYFEVQRSAGNGEWKTIGRLKAAGTSNSKHSYQYTDANVLVNNARTLYYRLKTTDLNSSYAYSTVVTVAPDKNSASNAALVYPNPFTDVVFIALESSDNTSVTIDLTDITGKKILSRSYQNIQGSSEIYLTIDAAVNNGIYFLGIEKNGVRSVQKLIKQ